LAFSLWNRVYTEGDILIMYSLNTYNSSGKISENIF
jgi:hypothetical protein